jgi:spermidine/putrescine transport system substrate-binding protein
MSEQNSHAAGPLARRHLLGAAAGLGIAGHARAQAKPMVDIITVPGMVGGQLKTILDEDAGCDLVNGPYQSSTDSVSRLTAAGGQRFDIICSSFEFSRPVVMGPQAGQEKVQELDRSLLPNLTKLSEASRAGVGERDGKLYMIPISWGFDSILFNKDVVPVGDSYTQSWSLLFEDRYAGRIAWWDTAHQMILAAGLYLGHAEPEKMDRAQVTEVGRFLISKKRNVRTFFTTFAQGTALLANGEVVVSYGIVPMRAEMEQRGFPTGYALPKEGVTSLMMCGYVPKNARNARGAHAVLNAMMGERYCNQITPSCGYLPVSPSTGGSYTPEERHRLGFGIFDGSVKHYPQRFPANMNMWLETWARVKSA